MGSGRKRKVSSEDCTFGGFDLIIADLPEGLPVPNVSSPPHVIPAWNDHKRKNIEALFEFACAYLTDDGPLLLFVPEKKDVRDDVRTFAASYDFVLRKDWWGFNELPLCYPLDTSLTVYIKLYYLLLRFILFSLYCIDLLNYAIDSPAEGFLVVYRLVVSASCCFFVLLPSQSLFFKKKMKTLRWMWRPWMCSSISHRQALNS